MKNNLKEFVDVIFADFKAKGLTTNDIAAIADATVANVCKWRNGTSVPSGNCLFNLIAYAYRFCPEALNEIKHPFTF